MAEEPAAGGAKALTPLETISRFPTHDGSLWSFVKTRADLLGDKPFLVFAGREMSWSAFARRVQQGAAVFAERGVKAGDRVGVMMENHPAIAIAFIALARLGAIMVPVNPTFKAEEARRVLGHAEVCGVLCSPSLLAIAREACAGMSPVPWFMLGEAATGSAESLAVLDSEMGKYPGPFPEPVGNSESICVLIYTSGTTGTPKGVMHAQSSVVIAGEGFVERMHLQPDDRLLCILPMFHINALFYSFSGAIAAGATLAIEPKFSASTFWKAVSESGATHTNTIAAISNILIQRPRSEYVPGHRLRKIYAAPLTPEMYRIFLEEFGVPHMIEGYGMSEIPGVLNNPFGGHIKMGSMGVRGLHPDHARPFADMRIADDDGNFLGDDQIGELVVKTPIVMRGYFRDPEQTRAAFRDGWFLTGDLGYRDADGYFWFVARKKDIIRRRGENISGAELDRVIGEHPAVDEAAAIPVPSDLGEDDILVAVILKSGQKASAKDIAEWCQARLSPQKVPRYVAFVDSLPHTPTHRVEKFKLRDDRSLRAKAIDLSAAG